MRGKEERVLKWRKKCCDKGLNGKLKSDVNLPFARMKAYRGEA
jgi:hypothetical protein